MTQRYYGSKIVTAWPAQNEGQDGYGVKYEDGYTSWSPKKVFEDAYIPLGNSDSLPGWQERIVAEYVQLEDRLNKLGAFLEAQAVKQTLEDVSLELLDEQAKYMAQYLEILSLRIGIHGIAKVWNGPEKK